MKKEILKFFSCFFPLHNMKMMVHISCHRGISKKMSNCHTGIRINHVDIFILSYQNKVWQTFAQKMPKTKKGTQRILFQFHFISYPQIKSFSDFVEKNLKKYISSLN